MTISTTSNRARYEGNGATTAFTYSFRIDDEDEVSVILVDADGVETTLTAGQYSITGIGSSSGGTVTYPLSGSPLAAGNQIVIVRTVPLTQETDLTNQGGFYPEVIETSLDRLTMITQQLQARLDRTIRFPITDPVNNAELENYLTRANSYLYFDENGDVSFQDSQIDTIYYGSSSTAPTTRPSGTARQTGDLYYNSVSRLLYVWNGAGWVATTASVINTVDAFTGDGATTAFTMSGSPVHENNLIVAIDGVIQYQATFSVSDTTLTFSTAPPNGSAIQVMWATLDTAESYVTQRAITTNTNLTATHIGQELLCNPGGGTITLTCTNNQLVGAKIMLIQTTAGTVTVAAGAGATLRNSGSSYTLYGQWAVALLTVVSNATGTSAEWVLSGEVL